MANQDSLSMQAPKFSILYDVSQPLEAFACVLPPAFGAHFSLMCLVSVLKMVEHFLIGRESRWTGIIVICGCTMH